MAQTIKKRIMSHQYFAKLHYILLYRIINMLTLVKVLYLCFSQKKNPSKKEKKEFPTFSMVNTDLFMDALRAFFSTYRYFPNIHFIVLDDGSLRKYQKWILKNLPFKTEYLSIEKQNRILKKIKKFQWIYEFAHYGWSGRKFIIPLLYKTHHKTMLLDSDTLFLREPTFIKNWLKTDKKIHLFLSDYENFSVISTIEATQIVGKKLINKNVNSGLICFDMDTFWKTNSLKKINQYIKEIVKVNVDRMTYDYYPEKKFKYVFPIIEQSLHWLTLDAKAKPLPYDYFVYPKHKFGEKALPVQPTFFHFTGEIQPNKPMILYLQSSFWISLKNIFNRHTLWSLSSDFSKINIQRKNE